MRLFQGALDTPLDSPLSATLSVHGLHFTVCAPPRLSLRRCFLEKVSIFWGDLGVAELFHQNHESMLSGFFRSEKLQNESSSNY